MDRTAIDRGDPAALGRLIALGVGAEREDLGEAPDSAAVRALLDRGAGGLVDASPEAPPEGRARVEALTPPPASVGELLARDDAPLELLRAIKAWGRQRVHEPDEEATSDAAAVLYYAAIAAALVASGRRITRLGDGELLAGLIWAESLRAIPDWLHPRLVGAQTTLWENLEQQIEAERRRNAAP